MADMSLDASLNNAADGSNASLDALRPRAFLSLEGSDNELNRGFTNDWARTDNFPAPMTLVEEDEEDCEREDAAPVQTASGTVALLRAPHRHTHTHTHTLTLTDTHTDTHTHTHTHTHTLRCDCVTPDVAGPGKKRARSELQVEPTAASGVPPIMEDNVEDDDDDDDEDDVGLTWGLKAFENHNTSTVHLAAADAVRKSLELGEIRSRKSSVERVSLGRSALDERVSIGRTSLDTRESLNRSSLLLSPVEETAEFDDDAGSASSPPPAPPAALVAKAGRAPASQRVLPVAVSPVALAASAVKSAETMPGTFATGRVLPAAVSPVAPAASAVKSAETMPGRVLPIAVSPVAPAALAVKSAETMPGTFATGRRPMLDAPQPPPKKPVVDESRQAPAPDAMRERPAQQQPSAAIVANERERVVHPIAGVVVNAPVSKLPGLFDRRYSSRQIIRNFGRPSSSLGGDASSIDAPGAAVDSLGDVWELYTQFLCFECFSKCCCCCGYFPSLILRAALSVGPDLEDGRASDSLKAPGSTSTRRFCCCGIFVVVVFVVRVSGV